MHQFENGGCQHLRKRKYLVIDCRLAALKKKRLESREIDLYVYADAGSQLIEDAVYTCYVFCF